MNNTVHQHIVLKSGTGILATPRGINRDQCQFVWLAKKVAVLMHRFHRLLAIVCAIALTSCEPEQTDADAGNNVPVFRDRNGKDPISLPRNYANHERVSAQDSLGKAPLPRNMVATVDDTCPVHHEKMKICGVPIVYETTAPVNRGLAQMTEGIHP